MQNPMSSQAWWWVKPRIMSSFIVSISSQSSDRQSLTSVTSIHQNDSRERGNRLSDIVTSEDNKS